MIKGFKSYTIKLRIKLISVNIIFTFNVFLFPF